MQKLTNPPTWQDIQQAHESINPYIHRSPVLSNHYLNQQTGANLLFKCENFQKIGAFKMRGATCALLAFSANEKAKGVATDSSGNHAQGIALAAQKLGIKAYIVMPQNAPKIKYNAVKDYGATIIRCGNAPEDRAKKVQEVVAETGAVYVPSYNDYNIIAGQATAAKELLEDHSGINIMMTPIGGGGLMSGTALSTHYMRPQVKVIGAEPFGADDAYQSFKAGKIIPNKQVNTIADGLRTNLKDKTFDIIRKYVQDIIRVTEEDIVTAMRLLWERMKIVVEPSAAVPLAAVLSNKERFEEQTVGIILSGGNVDLEQLPF